ncbi:MULTISPECIES: hypothetical protein [Pacificibacter]|uniref:hypothetical protein n=1 Tax=Pacificibacter TaxID=1042323 RepID=UPI001C0A069C|nr:MULTISPECIES: hypothetical protein [Pacificibacter]MBU2937714.1 hypothetical protein [Pacificibacter marinus]MDO6616208.1 hypothetical protein [Pacificibacter sp. 1_MG-2023]
MAVAEQSSRLVSTLPSALVALGNASIIAIPGFATHEKHWVNRVNFDQMDTVAQISLSLAIMFSLYVFGLGLVFFSDLLRQRFDKNHHKRFKYMMEVATDRLHQEWKDKEIQAKVLSGFVMSFTISSLLNFSFVFVGSENVYVLLSWKIFFALFLSLGTVTAAWKIAKLQFHEIDSLIGLDTKHTHQD